MEQIVPHLHGAWKRVQSPWDAARVKGSDQAQNTEASRRRNSPSEVSGDAVRGSFGALPDAPAKSGGGLAKTARGLVL